MRRCIFIKSMTSKSTTLPRTSGFSIEFKDVRVKRVEEGNYIVCYGNDMISYTKVSYTVCTRLNNSRKSGWWEPIRW